MTYVHRSLLLLFLGTSLAGAPAAAQSSAPNSPGASAAQTRAQRSDRVAMGRVVGRVVDSQTGEPLPGTEVEAVGTGVSVLAGVDGRFMLANVPAGPRSLRAAYLGYGAKTVEGVMVPGGGAVEQDIALSPQALELGAVRVTAARERGTVTAAVNEQRAAVGVTSATTAEQISKSPDGDAAQAVQRVSGVTVEDGKYVFVRGLGERYTTTSLNGARVPSPEPEKKVVPLDLFPSTLLEAITTSKTFTPDQPGDFSGASVNLRTRSFPARRMFHLSLSGGYNTAATGRDMLIPASEGGEWLAMAAGHRALPDALTDVQDFSNLSRRELNALIRSMPRDWMARQGAGKPNVSSSFSFGGDDPVLGHRFGYVGSLTYSRSQEARLGEIRARAVPGDSTGTPVPYNTFTGATGQSSVLWGGLLNLSTYFGRRTKIELNNTYDRTADNIAHQDWGTLEEFMQVDSVRRTSLQYVERTVRSSQLRGEHQLGEHNRIRWTVTSSGVSRVEPDRADMAYGYETAPTGERLPLAWLGFIPEAAKRTTSSLSEDAWNGDIAYDLSFGAPERQTTLRFGGGYRYTTRDATSASYNLRAAGLDAAARAASPDALFYGAYTEGDAGSIILEPNASGGAYNATDRVAAGFVMADVPLTSWLRLVGGARFERWNLDMQAEPTERGLVDIERDNTDILPSLALNARVSESQTVRLSVTQTLARPEYRELAPISYRDMLGEREVFGDSSLVRTLVQNYDLRWEYYPSLSEVVSIGLFAKHFDNPIEQIDVATSGVSQLSFINAASAMNYGVELELRKGLDFLGGGMEPFGVFANVTLMKSRINTSNSTLSALTNDRRPMVGQAPYVVNTGLSYAAPGGGASATLLYNVVGRRITSAAVTPITVDTYEQPRQQLDFSFRLPLRGDIAAKLDARNLLDAPYEERQGDVVRHRYSTGRSLSLGFSLQLD